MVAKRKMSMAAATLLALTTIPVFSTPASAVSSTCDPKMETDTAGVDEYRSAIKCSAIGSDSKVRAWLDVNLGPDGSYTPYFYQVNVWKYGPWVDFASRPRGPKHETRAR